MASTLGRTPSTLSTSTVGQAGVAQQAPTRSITCPLREHARSAYWYGELPRITVAGTQAPGIGPHGEDYSRSVRKALREVQQEGYGRCSCDRGGSHAAH